MFFEIKNICKSFSSVEVLKHISLEINSGKILGIVGENGAGKSTLMNIIGGIHKPSSGEMYIDGKQYLPLSANDAKKNGIAFVHQELNLFPNLSISDNFFIESFPKYNFLSVINKKKLFNKTVAALKLVGLNLNPNELVDNLSPGERQLVEISKAVVANANLIIFDEPTTSLTNKEVDKLFDVINSLRKNGKAIVFISHNLQHVLHLADEITVLKDGEVIITDDSKSFDANSIISHMVGKEIKDVFPSRDTNILEEEVVNVKDLSAKGIVKNINFTLRRGEVLGLFGLMGSGRSELAQILFGLERFDSGEILLNNEKVNKNSIVKNISEKLAFVTENRRVEGLLMDATIEDNLSLSLIGSNSSKSVFKIINKEKTSRVVSEITTDLKIKFDSLTKQKVEELSGGNQQKVVIGKWLLTKPKILIIDEPTRGIDVGAKLEIYTILNKLVEQGVSILFISSEIEELIGMCDRIMVMHSGEIMESFNKDNFNEENILRAAFSEN